MVTIVIFVSPTANHIVETTYSLNFCKNAKLIPNNERRCSTLWFAAGDTLITIEATQFPEKDDWILKQSDDHTLWDALVMSGSTHGKVFVGVHWWRLWIDTRQPMEHWTEPPYNGITHTWSRRRWAKCMSGYCYQKVRRWIASIIGQFIKDIRINGIVVRCRRAFDGVEQIGVDGWVFTGRHYHDWAWTSNINWYFIFLSVFY